MVRLTMITPGLIYGRCSWFRYQTGMLNVSMPLNTRKAIRAGESLAAYFQPTVTATRNVS